jgi:hypothetical protein
MTMENAEVVDILLWEGNLHDMEWMPGSRIKYNVWTRLNTVHGGTVA